MRIVLTADDFGYTPDTVAATIECFERGALTSASLMVKRSGTDAAFAWARAHPEHSWGVHLTFVSDGDDWPVLPPAKIPDLVAPNGQFLGSNHVRLLALAGRVPVDQISAELEAQLGRARDAGIALSYVDSHGHVHKFAPFREALRRVLPRFGITRVRSVQDVYLKRPWKSPTFWLGAGWRFGIRRRFRTTDHLYLPTSAGDQAWSRRLLATVKRGTLEVAVHPGFEEPWKNAERAELQAFSTQARAAGHQVIGWRDV